MTRGQKTKTKRLIKALRSLPDKPAFSQEPVKVQGNGLFQWDFGVHKQPLPGDCGTLGCAVGLGSALGLLPENAMVWEAGGVLGVPPDIFFDPQFYGEHNGDPNLVTPGMVADALQKELDRNV